MADALWPALIGQADWDALRQMLLPSPDRQRSRSTRKKYLLSRGIAWCGACGQRLVGHTNDRHQRSYYCAKGPDNSGCGGVCCSAPRVDRLVVEALLYGYAHGERPPAEGLTAASQPETCVLDTLADLLLGARVAPAVWQVILAGIPSVSENQADSDYAADLLGDALVAAFERLPFDVRRQRIIDDISRIIIHPTNVRGRFDPSRVEIVWAP